jgi:nitroreductase
VTRDVTDLPLLEGLATTRAIRRFRPEPIPEADLARILWAASRAPSGSNRQPFRFIVLRDGPRAARAKHILGEAFQRAWAAKRVADGYSEGSGVRDDSPKARTARAVQHLADHFDEVPVVVLACLARYRQPVLTEGASVYPACQNLLLAARALGYGGVLSTWHGLVEDELRSVLDIPDDVAICATIPLGRPVGRHGPVRRQPLGELVYDDGWGEPAAWAVDPPGTRFTRAGPPSDRGGELGLGGGDDLLQAQSVGGVEGMTPAGPGGGDELSSQ